MELHVFGANSHGQLGVGRPSEFELPMKVDNPPQDISQIVCGSGHTFITQSNGQVWVCGWNKKGQLGIGSTSDCSEFVKLECQQKFCLLSCGWDVSAGITEDGKLFLWGSNKLCGKQLGFCNENSKILTRPTELSLPFDEKAKDIQFGLRHCVILTKSHKVLLLGSLKTFEKVKHELIHHNNIQFFHLHHDCKVIQIASGQNHFTILDENNYIRSVGDNRFMQCINISPSAKVARISSGWTHSSFLTVSGELYLYGRNCYGQLANGTRETTSNPQKCIVHPVDAFQLGSEHGILKSNEKIFTWGWNEHGNCGVKDFEDILTPTAVSLKTRHKIKKIAAGSGFCMVVCS